MVAFALSAGCKGGEGTTEETAGTTTSTGTTAGTMTGTTPGTTGPTTGATTEDSGTTATSGATTEDSGTTAGTTDDGPVACDPQNLPGEGAPCENIGEFCSPGCQDPCQFCNVLECVNGTWQGVEVFPAPCAACEDICPSVVDAGCPGGPPDLQICIDGCSANLVGPCKVEYGQVRACSGLTPTLMCDMNGRPTVAGCEAQYEAFYACLFP